jgi:alpha-1,3-mannosyltransferase
VILRRLDCVIADSRSDEAAFRAVIPQIRRIDNGVDCESFAAVRGLMHHDRPRFLYFGRIARNKRVHSLIDVFAELSRRRIEFSATIAGADFDDLLPQLKAKVTVMRLEDRVRFAGDVSQQELLNLVRDSDYFINASEYEGFGISVVEAMAAGRVVIVSLIEAFKDLVSDGVNGFLVDFRDPQAAANRVIAILEDRREVKDAVAERAAATARWFSWERRADEFVSLYREMFERRKAQQAGIASGESLLSERNGRA